MIGSLRLAVTGASGLIGSSLVPALSGAGHQVTRLVRSAPAAGEIRWNPAAGELDPNHLEGLDAVVHLAGENIAGGWWTAERKRRILESRVQGTRLLAGVLAGLKSPPKVLVSASAVGYYGDRGDSILTEESPAGEGFLAAVAEAWESAAKPARTVGIRVVHLRLGMVLSRAGGALAQMLPPFRLGLGGPLGNGRQWMSWVALDDAIGALLHALATETLTGPVNAVAPEPVTNADFTRTLGRVLHRPTLFRVPASVLRLTLGEMADALLLSCTRVLPHRLLESGYRFHQPSLEGALRHLLTRDG
ncbi:MAG: TIGR01777 family oxidoreductase [Gemmatimonadales bacterium]